MNSCIE